MATPLLKTKFHIPAIRLGLVSRSRLVERLNAGLGRKLTILSAPPGFGKTTLLSEWISDVDRNVAWVSLDEDDNDPACFWACLITALQTIQPGAGKAILGPLRSSPSPPIKPLLTALINEIAEMTEPFTLVLDDYHVIEFQPIHDSLAFMLDHMPPQMHVILSTRVEPFLPLGCLRGQGQLTELRTDDLRFTFDETATFLNQVVGLDLSDEDVRALEARTEGWIAGLQMAALALQRALSTQGREGAHRFIVAFTGSHRYIMDYLAEQVLRRQSPSVRAFLLETAILDYMTGSLCDAVRFGPAESPIGRDDGQTRLEQLEAANLFVVALDGERRWYRYHHLFAELLRQQLSRTQPDRVATLHRRASAWYEENELIAEAVRHALAAGDIERVTHLVKGNALAMMDHGELSTILRWLDALPNRVVYSRPWLCVMRAWALVYVARVGAIEPWLRRAEAALTGTEERGQVGASLSQAEERHLLGHIAAIRGCATAWQGDMSRARELARRALELLPDGDSVARGFATFHLARCSHWDGDLSAAVRAYAEASKVSQAAGNSHVAILAKCGLAELLVVQGQLHRAIDACREARQLAEKQIAGVGGPSPITGLINIRRSRVLLHRNELKAAARYTTEGIALCDRWGQTEFVLLGLNTLARVLQARGDPVGAFDACRKALRIARGISPWPVAYVKALEAWLQLAQGDVAAAALWARQGGLSAKDEITFQREFVYLTLARLLIAQGRLGEALGLLARLLETAETLGATGSAIEILVLRAVALQAQGEADRALDALKRAITLAEPEGYVRVFVNEGAPMVGLLRRAAARGIAFDYVSRLLAALEREQGGSFPGIRSLAEPLSEREIEVLRLIVAGLSNREITASLYVSINTVKTHVKAIYGKLNVRNRVQAAIRARELGLV